MSGDSAGTTLDDDQAAHHDSLDAAPPARRRVLVVGPSARFLSGLTVYTCRMANALADRHDVSVLLLDRLLPQRLYPGGDRVGKVRSTLRYRPDVFDLGRLDWYWGPNIVRVARAIKRERPDALVLQWWTVAALHSFVMLAFLARRNGARIIIEFHEVQDTGEAAVPLLERYLRRFMPILLRLATGAIFHSEHDLRKMRKTFGRNRIDRLDIEIAHHGPYDHFGSDDAARDDESRPATTDTTRLLFFGLIRPYKGLEDLLRAFNSLPPEQAQQFSLTVVGETWEGWILPTQLIERSPHRERIEFVNRYVDESEIGDYFANADALVLPYRRGSASGPLHIAMSFGIHCVLYGVGGLVEAVESYAGAHIVTPNDIDALTATLLQVATARSERFDDPHSWASVTDAVTQLSGTSTLR